MILIQLEGIKTIQEGGGHLELTTGHLDRHEGYRIFNSGIVGIEYNEVRYAQFVKLLENVCTVV